MATISLATMFPSQVTASTGPVAKQWLAAPVVVDVLIDYAKVLVGKGSALAASDVIEAIKLPAGTVVHLAGIQQIVAADSTTLTLHLGRDVDNDGYVASYDAKAGAVGAYATPLNDVSDVGVLVTTADTIDVTFATLTGTLATGKIRVWALVTMLESSSISAGLAQVGS